MPRKALAHFVTLLVLAGAIQGGAYGDQPAPAHKTTLRVSLFPYIPDAAGDHYAALERRIKEEFERRNPNVELRLTHLDPNAEFYSKDGLKKMLTCPADQGGVDVVETDTLFLGDLVADGLIDPWTRLPMADDLHPAATAAATVGGTVYAAPHWLCGFFAVTDEVPVADAHDAVTFAGALDHGTHPRHLVGCFAGSFTLPAIYLDAYEENYGPVSLPEALAKPADPATVELMSKVFAEGKDGATNPCLGDTYKDDKDVTLAVPPFAHGEIDAFVGYSERLYHILKASSQDRKYRVTAVPFGRTNVPALYVDGLVLRRGLDPAARTAAEAFAAYIDDPATMEWILASRDAGAGGTPRYLLPATNSAFDTPSLKADPYYPMLREDIKGASSLPNTGYVAAKDRLKAEIMELVAGSKP